MLLFEIRVQYKIVMGVVPTNNLLVTYYLKLTYSCAFCNNIEETIGLLYCDCKNTDSLMAQLNRMSSN